MRAAKEKQKQEAREKRGWGWGSGWEAASEAETASEASPDGTYGRVKREKCAFSFRVRSIGGRDFKQSSLRRATLKAIHVRASLSSLSFACQDAVQVFLVCNTDALAHTDTRGRVRVDRGNSFCSSQIRGSGFFRLASIPGPDY